VPVAIAMILSNSMAVANGLRYGPAIHAGRFVGRIMDWFNLFVQSPAAAMQREGVFSSVGCGNISTR